MKKHFPIYCALLACFMILGTGSVFSRSYELSPALEIISEEIELKKCTVQNREVKFTPTDFEDVLGTTVEYITVTSLPSQNMGILKYAGADVYENQSVARKNISLLKFVPNLGAVGSASFEFCADGSTPESSSLCTISVLESVNLAPVAQSGSYCAFSGIGLVKTLSATDPEGDDISIEITGYPEKGLLKVSGSGFTYTPFESFSGKDSFTYCAVDVYGNKSAEAVASISVEKPLSDIRFDDMQGHWGYTSAMKMAQMGLMGGSMQDGELCFCPDEPISRGDFLAMAMIAAGLEEKVSLGARTTFADDAEIPSNIRSYASYAVATGIVSGYVTESGEAFFESSDSITRAEAASMLSKILDTESAVCEYEFVDAMSVPSWAKNGFNSLVSLGIINGNPGGTLAPQRTLTRAEAAQILCNTMEYIEEKTGQQEEKGFFEKILDFFK